jgi:hypothetical protein
MTMDSQELGGLAAATTGQFEIETNQRGVFLAESILQDHQIISAMCFRDILSGIRAQLVAVETQTAKFDHLPPSIVAETVAESFDVSPQVLRVAAHI